MAEVARLFFESGHIVICTFISPFRSDREFARSLVPEGRFIEVFVDAPLDVVRSRDPKGLYEKAERGEIADFTGVTSPYEAPVDPEVRVNTVVKSPEDAVSELLGLLRQTSVVD